MTFVPLRALRRTFWITSLCDWCQYQRRFKLPAVDDVADEVEVVAASVWRREIQQGVGLAPRRSQMDVRDEDGADLQLRLCVILVESEYPCTQPIVPAAQVNSVTGIVSARYWKRYWRVRLAAIPRASAERVGGIQEWRVRDQDAARLSSKAMWTRALRGNSARGRPAACAYALGDRSAAGGAAPATPGPSRRAPHPGDPPEPDDAHQLVLVVMMNGIAHEKKSRTDAAVVIDDASRARSSRACPAMPRAWRAGARCGDGTPASHRWGRRSPGRVVFRYMAVRGLRAERSTS